MKLSIRRTPARTIRRREDRRGAPRLLALLTAVCACCTLGAETLRAHDGHFGPPRVLPQLDTRGADAGPAIEPVVVEEPGDRDEGRPGWKKWLRRVGHSMRKMKSKVARKLGGGEDQTWTAAQAQARAPEVERRFAVGHDLFRKEQYAKAEREFRRLAKAYEDRPPEEEALFMQAECLFMLKKLPKAQDTYARLLNKYPTTRYLPQAVQRTYDIAYYWLEDSRRRAQGKDAERGFSQRINIFDRTRPILDTNGRALEAIETIEQYDPFGPLTDDAVMMAGAHHFINGRYVRAAGFYEQLVADQPKSEHAARALILGAQAYLRSYDGPAYDGQYLDDAHRLTKAALTRSAELSPEQVDRLRRDLRLIYLEKARRDHYTAELYERLNRPGAARYYYSLVEKNYADTQWAAQARQAIQRLDSGEPAPAENPFSRLAQRIRGLRPTSENVAAAEAMQPAPEAGPKLQPPVDTDVRPASHESFVP